ncbi:MAG: hypothetical protein MJZ74_09000 [Muribaculaceae bacterium]|nr:hypothetical protein [Muribaculaceae bacterium]
MAKLKDFFSMSRHERRGAVVVLVLLAVALCCHMWMGRKPAGDAPLDMQGQEQRFIEQCNSIDQSQGGEASAADAGQGGAVDYSGDKTEFIPEGASSSSHSAHHGKGSKKSGESKKETKKDKKSGSKTKAPVKQRQLDEVPAF